VPRKPAGTYTRSTSEWFFLSSVSAGCEPNKMEGDQTSFCEVALYNDSQQGRLLQLDAIDVYPAGDDFDGFHYQGVDGALYNGGIGDGKGSRLYSGWPTQDGAIYTYTNAALPAGVQSVNRAIGRYGGSQQGASTFDPDARFLPNVHIEPRGPLAMILPGYSFGILFVPFSGFVPFVTFWWSVLASG
jgi:hypothetical protein